MKTRTIKRMLSCILTLVMLLSTLPALNISAAEVENAETTADAPIAEVEAQKPLSEVSGITDDYFEYKIYNEEVTITDYLGFATELTIPAEIEGYPVTSIGKSAFSHCTTLESITIPESVTSIDNDAFSYCSSLKSITIPNGVKSVGYEMLYGCNSLERITLPFIGESEGAGYYGFGFIFGVVYSYDTYGFIPDSLKEIVVTNETVIGYYDFYGCEGITSITIPDSVTTIGERAFSNCESLTSITIPEGVTKVGDYAFAHCSNLKSITIPSSVNYIGEGAFTGCGITDVYYLSSYRQFKEDVTGNTNLISEKVHYANTEEYLSYSYDNSALTATVTGCDPSVEIVTIPNAIIKNDKIYTVTNIGDSVFENHSNITSVTIPEGVTSIGEYAFSGCVNLASVTIPDSTIGIGKYAFINCGNLTSVAIPDGVTSIEECTFSGCISLTSVILPDSITDIGIGAFKNCNRLKNIRIPDSVTSINYGAFYGCNRLEKLTIPFVGETLGGIKNTQLGYIFGTSDYYDYSIPSTLKEIVVTKARVIGDCAFYECPGLTSVTISDTVTSIRTNAFYNCKNLTSIILPKSVETVEDHAFYGCKSFTDVWYAGTIADKKALSIESDNSYFNDATWHYNTCTEEHVYSGECDSMCSNCEWKRTAEVGHVYSSLCDADCNVCGDTREVSHTWGTEFSLDDKGHWIECSVCKEIKATREDHYYDNACDVYCNTCGYERTELEHNYILNGGFTCNDCGHSKAPDKPIVKSKTHSSVTLISTSGFEYSKDGIIWQSSNEFTELTSDTNYMFCQRVAGTSEYPAGEASDYVRVKTDEMRTLESISVAEIPTEVSYLEGEGGLTVIGGKLTLIYSDGTTETIDMTAEMFSKYDPTLADDQVISIEYIDKTITFKTKISNTSAGTVVLFGDANGDGKINVKDATQIQKAAASLVTLDDVQILASDANGDGKVNVKDATAIQKFVAGIPVNFPIGEERKK